MKQPLPPGQMDEAAVRLRLLEYKTVMETIKALCDPNTGRFPGKDWPEARRRMRDLKEALEVDYRSRCTVKGEAAMTDAEERLFYPAIEGAKSHISVRWDSRPSGRWFDELSEALIDIEFHLLQIDSVGSWA